MKWLKVWASRRGKAHQLQGYSDIPNGKVIRDSEVGSAVSPVTMHATLATRDGTKYKLEVRFLLSSLIIKE
jgi:hypothetical protein